MLKLIISFTIGFILGIRFWIMILSFVKKQQIISKKRDIKNQFQQVLENLKKGKTKFKTRIKNTVLIETNLLDFGQVGLIFFLDKNQISIFKEEKCLYTTEDLEDLKTTEEISSTINEIFHNEINDVIDVMGITVSRSEFEKNFNQQVKNLNLTEKENNEIDKIIEDNTKKLDTDEILDKINKNGIDSLTKTELEYLKKLK